MSNKPKKEQDATHLAQAISSHKPVQLNRLLGVAVRSECDTSVYVLSQRKHPMGMTIIPVVVAEGDYVWVNNDSLYKNAYDRHLLWRTLRKLPSFQRVNLHTLQIVAQYGATGIILNLPADMNVGYKWDDLSKPANKPMWLIQAVNDALGYTLT